MTKYKLIKTLGLITPMVVSSVSHAQTHNAVSCGTEHAMETLYIQNPASLVEAKQMEQMSLGQGHAIRSTLKSAANASANIDAETQLVANPTYVIPVVFHVYGTSFNGQTVNDAIIIDALQKTNEDFQGLTTDFNQIISEFAGVKDTLNIEFRLAKKAPDGSSTTGINYYGARSGYGNGSGYDAQIQADAWDNYKYMNVYIQNDLYADGGTYNSGVAWYPDTWMSNNNLARVVYNGAYLGTNTSENFRSVLTHEFGHYLNLIHTFEGSCSATNENYCSSTGDEICDTPQVDNSSLGEYPNCMGQTTNWQNFMNYSSQYANFTYNQVSRMINALNVSARNTLWTPANLADTGTDGGGTIPGNEVPVSVVNGPYNAIENNAISFSSIGSNDPDGTIARYSWDFGDGNSSSSANPTHTYANAGTYSVTLTVTDDKGATGTSTTTAEITPSGGGSNELTNGVTKSGLSGNRGESLDYFIDIPSGATNFVVSMDGGSGDADLYTLFGGTPSDNNFNCRPYIGGNKETCNEPNPSSGRWYVTVKAYSTYSGVNLTASYDLNGNTNERPVALVNGPYTGSTNSDIPFSSNGSYDPDGSIASYEWSFGDGGSSTMPNPTHTYSTAGTYAVSLTVTDNQGATAVSSTTAEVSGGGSGLVNACSSQGPTDYVSVTNGTPLCVTSNSGGYLYFYFLVNNESTATIRTEHGSGDVALYYNNNNWPSTAQYNQMSDNAGNTETITINNLASGWNYIMLDGNHSGVTIQLDMQ